MQDALVINLLTEDNLPSYHFEIAARLGRDGAWGTWVHRWTAEEDRHSTVLRAFIHARRAVDPVALERLRMSHVSTGWSVQWLTPLHCLAYVTVQELATRQAHRNTGVLCGDVVGEALMARIAAADENLHMLFYRGLYADALRAFPDDAMAALADVLCGFEMPGTGIAGFRARAARVAAGICGTTALAVLRKGFARVLTAEGITHPVARERLRHHEREPGAARARRHGT
ncbi:acyl-ACP desaturase [Streptomyces sp. 24-1644]|uniref:acyl-ACP desaturase n=1 Tax=Streptomyces sp. 24-1644 TaxID=3457315 RepID=UPI003FA79D1E